MFKVLGVVLECPVLLFDAISVLGGRLDGDYYAGTGGICQELLRSNLDLPSISFSCRQSPEETLIAFSDVRGPMPYCEEFKKCGLEKLHVANHPLSHWHAVLARRLGEDDAAETYFSTCAAADSRLIEGVLRSMMTQQAEADGNVLRLSDEGVLRLSDEDVLRLFPWPQSAADVTHTLNAKFPFSLLLVAGLKGVENRSRPLNDECIADSSSGHESSVRHGWCYVITSKGKSFDTPANLKSWPPGDWKAFAGCNPEDLPTNVVDLIERAMIDSGHGCLVPWWEKQAKLPIPQQVCVGLVRWAPGNRSDAFNNLSMSSSPWYIKGNTPYTSDAAVLFKTPVPFPVDGLAGG